MTPPTALWRTLAVESRSIAPFAGSSFKGDISILIRTQRSVPREPDTCGRWSSASTLLISSQLANVITTTPVLPTAIYGITLNQVPHFPLISHEAQCNYWLFRFAVSKQINAATRWKRPYQIKTLGLLFAANTFFASLELIICFSNRQMYTILRSLWDGDIFVTLSEYFRY